MTLLKIVLVILGLSFTLFGFFIYFKKKYFLINGFEAAFKSGQKTEDYAKRVGLIEFIVGILILTVSLILMIIY